MTPEPDRAPGGPATTAASALARQRLGAELRRQRQNRALRLADVASRLGVAASTISRIESGIAPTRTSYLAVMLDLYGLDNPQHRAVLAELACDGNRKGWWMDYADMLPAQARRYIGLESAATRLRCYASHTIPDLLQTPSYAAAACHAARRGLTASQVSRYVDITTRRQRTLLEAGHELHLIVEESALLRAIGPRPVMTSQLHHILRVAARPSTTVQVVALAATRPVLAVPFTLLRFGEPADPDAAFECGPDGGTTITRRAAAVRVIQQAFTALTHVALPPAESADYIARLSRQGPV